MAKTKGISRRTDSSIGRCRAVVCDPHPPGRSGGVHLQARDGSVPEPADQCPPGAGSRSHQGRQRRPARNPLLSGEPAWFGYRFADPNPQRGCGFPQYRGIRCPTVAPVAAITNVGFAFNDYEHVWRAVDGKLGDIVTAQISKTGALVVAKAADNGFRQITSSSKPIKTPQDLQGYRIRVPVSPIFTSLFTALGANPTSINFNELYTALQTHLVDGQENGLVAIEAGKLYEVQKYVSMTNHIWDPFWILGNRRSFTRLPNELQEIVRHELDRAVMEQREDVVRLDASLKDQLTGKGLAFEQVDKDAFRGALAKAGFYKEWRDKFGDENWKALEAVVGPLA